MDQLRGGIGIFRELEALRRRARLVPLVIPVLLVAGFAAGRLVNGALRIPEGTRVRTHTEQPVMRGSLASVAGRMENLRTAGDQTAEYVQMYRREVAPIEQVLRRRGVPAATARKVAWPLVEQSYRSGIEPATVLSVLLLESGGRPRATSPVGARGLMQVMPAWEGFWQECSDDLYDIEGNLCNGTSILAWYMERFGGDERRALLGYNGCVRGTNTPDCANYPEKVARLRRQLRNELSQARRRSEPMAASGADD